MAGINKPKKVLDKGEWLWYTIVMFESILLYTLAGLGIFTIGFCVTFTYLTIREELKEN